MKRVGFALLLLLASTVVFFIYEQNRFNHYILHPNQGNMNIPINLRAPVHSKNQIVIAAPAEKVWSVLSDIRNWPKWQRAVKETTVPGGVAEGTVFRWKAGGLSFTSKIHTMKPNANLGWTGTTIGASAIHNWFFEDRGNQTLVRVEESLQGVFPSLFRAYFQKNLDAGVIANLQELKAASENNTY